MKKMKKKTTRPTAPKVTFVDLGPSAPPAPATPGKSLQWTTLTVGSKGALPVAPTRIEASTGDWVIWVVRNDSGRTTSVTLKDFTRRSDGKKLRPIRWVQPRAILPSRGVGVLVGQVTYAVTDPKGRGEAFRYTIEVRGPGAIDYDPDLEIRPPALDN